MKFIYIEYVMIYKLFYKGSHLYILAFSMNNCIFLKLKAY